MPIVHDGCHVGQILTGSADGSGDDLLAGFLGQPLFQGQRGRGAPIFGRVADLRLAVFNINVDRGVRDAFDHHTVEAGFFQCCSEVAARVGIVDAVRDRRFGYDRVAAAHEGARCVQRATHKSDHTFRCEDIGPCRHHLVDQTCAERHAARELPKHLIFQRHDLQGFLGQVHKKDLIVITVHTLTPLDTGFSYSIILI